MSDTNETSGAAYPTTRPAICATAKQLTQHLTYQRDMICAAAKLDPVEYHIRARSEAGGTAARVEFYCGEIDRVAVAECFGILQLEVVRWAALERERVKLEELKSQQDKLAQEVATQALKVADMEGEAA